MKVISGGQTGVDRAGLDAAIAAGLEVGGWVPRGRLAEDGKVPAQYPLRETDSHDYGHRTEANVQEADATLILVRGELTGGSQLTQSFCRKHKKPVAVIDLASGGDPAAKAQAFVEQHRPNVLNIAGPRESREPGIYAEAKRVLEQVFRALSGQSPA